MSNSLAIAAVTATLERLIRLTLGDDLSDARVTLRPPDKAEEDNAGHNRINLFLYQTEVSPHWRNRPMPGQVKPGETGQPPLPLDLYYLITAYGEEGQDQEINSHRLLGRAMRTLHDFPVLDPTEIEKAVGGDLAASDLHQQVERVRITPQPMSLDEMSKLWNTFQTQYRISAAYKASVVLIESQQAARTPLPVLRRGPEDRGVISQPDTEPPPPPFPAITAVEPADDQPSAELGTALTIRGYHLTGDDVSLRFRHPHMDAPFSITDAITDNTAEKIVVTLSDPDDPEPGIEVWAGPPGVYTVAALITKDGKQRATNEAPFGLAPKITNVDASRAGDDDVEVSVTFSPAALLKQRVSLLFGDREVHPERSGSGPHDSLEDVSVPDVADGDYFVRLRIDGVDSLLIDRTTPEPTFKESQKVTIP